MQGKFFFFSHEYLEALFWILPLQVVHFNYNPYCVVINVYILSQAL